MALGGPSVLIEIDDRRLLVDPTFDPAGNYPIGGRALTKTTSAILGPDDLGRVDAVLLSHDQHPDNLDHGGRAFLATVPLVLTTETAAGRLRGSSMGLATWASAVIGGTTVTAVPAQHGPDGTDHLTGPVIGFLLTTSGEPTIYVSGDNASLDVVRRIAERSPRPDVAILFAGAARTPLVDGFLTLTGDEAAQAAVILGRPRVLPVHTDGWAHFTENAEGFVAAFGRAGLADRLLDHTPGVRTPVQK